MTNEIREIDKAVAYEIITAMGEDGLSALLTADDLLASMAVPVTQFDFTYIDKRKLNKFMHEVERFVKFSRLRVNSYTKAGLQAKLETLWATNLPEEQKRELIVEYRIVDGFNEEGYAVFNEKNYLAWKSIFDKGQIPTLKYKAPLFGSGSKTTELIDENPFTIYKAEYVDGYWSVPLNISTEQWCKIIRGTITNIKRMLLCYLQITESNKRIPLQDMEKRFGIKWESFNAYNTALGRRAQQMLNFAVVDVNDETRRRYWSTAMTCGRDENGLWVWEPRPELMEAAEIVLREESFPMVKEV